MDEQTRRLNHLERQVRRLRRTVNVLLVGVLALLGAFVLGVVTEPEELTFRKLTIVDGELGKPRIVATTLPDGTAAIIQYDREGMKRIVVQTTLSDASISHYDRDGNIQITALVDHGAAAQTIHYDREGKMRIMAATLPSGLAGISISDHNGNETWNKSSQ